MSGKDINKLKLINGMTGKKFKDLVTAEKYIEKNNMNIFVDSSGTSREHFGENPFYNSIKVAKDNNIDIYAGNSGDTKDLINLFVKKELKKINLDEVEHNCECHCH